MPGSAAGHGAPGGVAVAADFFDPLAHVQKEGELPQGHGLLGVAPGALPGHQHVKNVPLHFQPVKVPGQAGGGICHGGLAQGWLGQFFVLVRFIALLLWGAADRHHKRPALPDGLLFPLFIHSLPPILPNRPGRRLSSSLGPGPCPCRPGCSPPPRRGPRLPASRRWRRRLPADWSAGRP